MPSSRSTLRPASIATFLTLAAIASPAADPPTLTTARAAHQLTIEESLRAYPVRLIATVTYYDPYIDARRPALFLSDATGGIFAALSSVPEVTPKAGDLIELAGVTGAGDFAPIVDRASARVIGPFHLPRNAPRVSMTHLLSGAEDGQWVEVEGVVRSIGESGHNIVLNIALGDGSIAATTIRQHGEDYSRLVDAKVLIRGNAAPLFNHHRQMTGARLLFPSLAAVKIEDPAPAQPFASPLDSAARLLRFTPDTSSRRRAHIRGIVTLLWPGRMLCVQDGSQGLCVQTAQSASLTTGEEADVIGFPSSGDFTPTMTDAIYRGTGRRRSEAATPVSAERALKEVHDAQLVQIEGQFIGWDRAAKDPVLMLSSGKYIFPAILPGGVNPLTVPSWREGSMLRITGICSVRAEPDQSFGAGFSVPSSFRILMRSPQDVVVVGLPSWWSATHLLEVLAVALLIILSAAIALLRQARRARKTASDLRREMIERQRAEDATRYALDQMEYQAHHDPLTKLANRLMFNNRMHDSLVSAEKMNACVGLLFLDLDRFKAVNDSLGHAAGDLLLQQAAERLATIAPQNSLLARLGGDEFAFLLPGISGRTQAEALGHRVVDALSKAFDIEGSPWHCPASVGLSIFPDDARCAALLMKNADTALYRAKRTAPGQVVTFDRLMSERAERSVLVEKALQRAVEKDGFSLVYQPQFRAGGELRGFEALLRLHDPVAGVIAPSEFIGVAEELGLIVNVGEWVLREACKQWVLWASRGRLSVSMAVNVSPVQLTRGNFPELLRSILAQTGMPARFVELELTETGIFTQSRDTLMELKGMGISIAVDDFGTGFSSLGSLHGAPVDYVKIDRSFVRDADCNPGTLPFIRTIVSLARSLGMRTVAEGVETVGQRDAVLEAGCDILQGYLLARPLTAANAALLLAANAQEGAGTVDDRMLVGALS